jgi:Lrp/AsnC family transcriptional regulator, leucine-responsive regulatory protein
MATIDLKDRKILYELDLDARQSLTQIGKKVGLKKDVVSYRIKRMEDEGIIKNYWTEINTFKLGYNVYRIYIDFQDIDLQSKNEMIKYLSNYKNAWAVMSIKGPIDLDLMLWVKDSLEFNQFWNDALDKYGKFFSSHTVSILTGGVAYKKSYILSDADDKIKYDREYFILRSGGKTVDFDEIDYKILDGIAVNARIPIIDLAEKLKCSSQTITYRMNNLIKNEVILAFRVGIDIGKLGLQNCVIDIYLKDHSKKKQIIDYMKSNPFVEYLVDSVGWCDLQFEIMVKSIAHLDQILEELDGEFPGIIRKHDFWMSKIYHRLRSLPELY